MPGFVSTLLKYIYSAPVRFVHVFLQVTLHVWQPMHLSKFMTIPICALIFKPIDLLQLADDDIQVALIPRWAVIVKAVAELGVAPIICVGLT